MTKMKFRKLIDMAIGSPDSGYVNFYALHCLISCIADKLELNDEDVYFTSKETEALCSCTKLSDCSLLQKVRLFGGTNAVENDFENEQNQQSTHEPDASEAQEIIQADVAQENETEEPGPQTENMPLIELKSNENQEDEKVIVNEQEPAVEVLSPSPSESSTKGSKQSLSQLSMHKLEDRLSKIELSIRKIAIPDDIFKGIAIMKDQLEFVIEQLLLLTFLTLSKKPDSNQIQQLHVMAQTLNLAKEDNKFIESSNRFELNNIPSINWHSSGLQLNEILSENDVLDAQSSISDHTVEETKDNELEVHLCYSPEKILDQLMELKGEFCLLTNKVSEISARLLEQESQRTLAVIYEIQQQIQDLKMTTNNLKEQHGRLDTRVSGNLNSIDNIRRTMEEILIEKVNKGDLEMQLADKVDYKQLQRKVSLDQMFELQCRIDKRFCEVLRQINENDKKISLNIENMRQTLGFAAIEGILKTFKEKIAKDIQNLQDLLKAYIDSTNDDCAAAGARIKVLQDLACLSCDTTCVMRSMEKAKVGKLPSAHASNILSPLITYELGSIRKSGIVGYYRKDEFPHSTNAWLTRQSNTLNNIKQCVPRHAGGQHTTNNAKDHVEKVMLNRKL